LTIFFKLVIFGFSQEQQMKILENHRFVEINKENLNYSNFGEWLNGF